MDLFDGIYYKSSKWYLSAIGLWPYQSNVKRRFRATFFVLVNLTLVIPQVIKLVRFWLKDFSITIENSVSCMFSAGCCAKYLVTYISSQRLARLFEQITSDWQKIIEPSERLILTKYTKEGKFLGTLYLYYVWFGWMFYTLMPFAPSFLDRIKALNESRPRIMPFYADYIFFDQDDYHYFSCWHIAFVYMTDTVLFGAVDCTFVLCVKHTSGLFAIICHRLSGSKPKAANGYAQGALKTINVDELRTLIIFHNNSITCFELLEDSFNLSFLVLNALCVLGLSLTVFYCLYIYNEYFKLTRIVVFIFGVIFHLLYLGWIGQTIIDKSGDVFLSAYNSKWYTISTKARAFIVIIMIRALEPCRLTAGKLSVLCMENFGILIQTSVSYVTVFLSVA